MKKYSILFICLALSLVAWSQKPVITFEVKEYNFGKVNEADGKITHVFDFKNMGNSPLVINRVQASCGCTTPTWTKEPIEPGQKGSITVTYNPLGRPGTFTKTITVYSNATEEQVLIIKGEVIPKQGTTTVVYPVNMGGLLAKNKVIQLNSIDKGAIQTRTLDIQNSTKNLLKPTFENLPPYLTVNIVPEILKPNEEGKITISFNSKNYSQWGPVSDDIYVIINGQKNYTEEFKISIFGNVVEDFSKMTLDQKRKAPILEIPVKSFYVGTLKAGSRKVIKYKVNNIGQNSLEIRRIINNNKEFSVRQNKISVQGGKSGEIIVELNTKNLAEGNYKKTFTIQTNDPDNSFMLLVISWTIQK